MDYIITNFHSNKSNKSVNRIRKALNPYSIIQSGYGFKDNCTNDFNNLQHMVYNDNTSSKRNFFRNITFVNRSKYLNSKIQIFRKSLSNGCNNTLIEWNENGRRIKYIKEKNVIINSDNIKYFTKMIWNDILQKWIVEKIKVVNDHPIRTIT